MPSKLLPVLEPSTVITVAPVAPAVPLQTGPLPPSSPVVDDELLLDPPPLEEELLLDAPPLDEELLLDPPPLDEELLLEPPLLDEPPLDAPLLPDVATPVAVPVVAEVLTVLPGSVDVPFASAEPELALPVPVGRLPTVLVAPDVPPPVAGELEPEAQAAGRHATRAKSHGAGTRRSK
jgi:fused signal recognition particle receptor